MSVVALGSWQHNFDRQKLPIIAYPYELSYRGIQIRVFQKHSINFLTFCINVFINVSAIVENPLMIISSETFLPSETLEARKARECKKFGFFMRMKHSVRQATGCIASIRDFSAKQRIFFHETKI